MSSSTDQYFMQQALQLAQQAADQGEVPVGAVVVLDGQIIGRGYNQPIANSDATAHAEIVALRHACGQQQNYRLPNSTLYVTIEPCTMCVGAMIHARVGRLVFGAAEPRAGAVVSALQLLQQDCYNHQIELSSGVLEAQCGNIMRDFFRQRRTL